MPVRLFCGDPDLSVIRCRELAVDADDTGSRGRELRSGGDALGGDDMTAVMLELFLGRSVSLPFPLEWVGVVVRDPGVWTWFVGGVERPAGLHGLSSARWKFRLVVVLVVNGEFERLDEVGLDESQEGFLITGSRLGGFVALDVCEVEETGGWNDELTPFMVFTLLSTKSLWLRL